MMKPVLARFALATFFLTSASPGTAQALSGAGATFPYPLYQKWYATFHKKFPDLEITYRPIGSLEGIEELAKGQADFAASDIPLKDAGITSYPVKIEHIPAVVGGVVLTYRLDDLPQDLRLTPEIVAAIYLGRIKRWNDPLLRASNRGVRLPDREIVAIHRSDRSGTTFILTSYLSNISSEWRSAFGAKFEGQWPAGVAARGNAGVAELVAQTPNSIGYVQLFYALEHRLSYALMKNRAGQFVQADLTTLSAAAAESSSGVPGDLPVSVLDPKGKLAYPIASFTYILVPVHFDDAAKAKTMTMFLSWMLDTGQKQCGSFGFAALPPNVLEGAKRLVAQIAPDLTGR